MSAGNITRFLARFAHTHAHTHGLSSGRGGKSDGPEAEPALRLRTVQDACAQLALRSDMGCHICRCMHPIVLLWPSQLCINMIWMTLLPVTYTEKPSGDPLKTRKIASTFWSIWPGTAWDDFW